MMKTSINFLLSGLLILGFTTLYAQSPERIYLSVSQKDKWFYNQHITSHAYTDQSDRLYANDESLYPNWYLRLGMERNRWLYEIGISHELFFSSWGMHTEVFDPEYDGTASITQRETTLGLDLLVGYEIIERPFLGRPITLEVKGGYSLLFSQPSPLNFNLFFTRVLEQTGEVLYTYRDYDLPGEQSHLSSTYHFAQGGIYLRYRPIDFLTLEFGGGMLVGFEDIGRTKVELNVPPEFGLLSETATRGTGYFLSMGLQFNIWRPKNR